MSNLTANHEGMRLGRRPSRPEDLARVPRLAAFVGAEIPEPPGVIDYLTGMSRLDILGNDKFGCCMYSALGDLFQAQTAFMGRERIFTEDEVLAMYSRGTGFNRNDPSTDNGSDMYDSLLDVQKHGFCEIEIEGFAMLDANDARACHQAMWLFGGVLWGVDLPLVAKRQNKWRLEMGEGDAQITPGGWGGHAVAELRSVIGPDGLPEEDIATWGAPKPVHQTFRDAGYVAQVFVVFTKGFVPHVPGFDRAGLLAAMKELRL